MPASGERPTPSADAQAGVVASFAVTPLSPSVFDLIRFFDYSYDRGRVGIASRFWQLGDGTTSNEALPTHRYNDDGEFTIQLTVTTADGRIGFAEQVVRVSTHDVAVVHVRAPRVAAAGDTYPIVVEVESRRRTETVQLELLCSGRHRAREQIGVLTQTVEPGAQTDFSFSYALTAADAAAGAVTFEALATIVGARDAAPADNWAAAPPTIVH
jgi:PKD domain